MYAALRGMTIDAFIYGGGDYDYPDWFGLYIATDCEEDGFDNLVWDDINELGVVVNCTTIIPYESAFLYKEENGKVYIHSFTLEDFDRQFYFVGDCLAALKENCVEAFVFDKYGRCQDMPDWVITYLEGGDYNSEDINDFDVFIKNRKGNVRCLKFEDFAKYYQT